MTLIPVVKCAKIVTSFTGLCTELLNTCFYYYQHNFLGYEQHTGETIHMNVLIPIHSVFYIIEILAVRILMTFPTPHTRMHKPKFGGNLYIHRAFRCYKPVRLRQRLCLN